ncbi:hypothetical protein BLD44_010730 [Mastigocladus laminosus UU774]|nr:hypothetical protein BLD44_010730 [Mastigocladus laminosus UU774]
MSPKDLETPFSSINGWSLVIGQWSRVISQWSRVISQWSRVISQWSRGRNCNLISTHLCAELVNFK